jgi:TonB family protein
MLNEKISRNPLGRTARYATALAGAAVTLVIAGAAVAGAERPAAVDAGLDDSRPPVASLVAPPLRDSAQAPRSAGQDATSIAGAVFDQLGGLLPGTAITITHVESRSTYQAVTDHAGSFTFGALPPGAYALEARLAGFATVNTVVNVDPGVTARRNMTLPLGSLQETVTIGGSRTAAAAGVPPTPPRPAAQPRRRAIPDPRQSTFAFGGGIGGNISVPRKVVNVNPVYPAEMQAAGKSGSVVLVGRIGIDGYLADLRPADTVDADPAFIASAMDAVQRWEFEPTFLNGVPVEANITISLHYEMMR